MKKTSKKIAIIGCGNMGGGIAQRLSKYHQLFLYDKSLEKASLLENGGYGKACGSLKEALKQSDILILAIKPQSAKEFSRSLQQSNLKHTVISILSGTTLEQLKKYFPGQKIIRLMPNMAVIAGESTIGLCTDANLSEGEIAEINALFGTLGKITWLTEDRFDAYTALTGSGIAFVFALIEAMVEAGISMGFNAQESQALVEQTMRGGLSLLDVTGEHPAALKWKVTSPAGTTIAGLRKFEEFGVRAGILNTFLGAYERAIEQSKQS